MSATPSDKLESDAYHEKPSPDGAFECSLCNRNLNTHDEELFISDCGKNVCEYCIGNVVKYAVSRTKGNSSKPYYGLAEFGQEDVSTGYYAARYEAKMRILSMVAKQYPNVIKVEDI